MKAKTLAVILLFAAMALVPAGALGGTNLDIIINPALGDTFTDEDQVESDFERWPNAFFKSNDKVIPNAFAMVNTMGYPNGKSTIKKFPHFEFGAAGGFGVLGVNRGDHYTDAHPSIPFFSANGGFHIGTGVADRIDVTLKFFSLGWFVTVKEEIEETGDNTSFRLKFTDSDIYSVGVKARYNWKERKTLIPILFSFGGISFNLGLDYMYGKWRADSEYSDVQTISFGTAGDIEGRSTISGHTDINWNIVSLTPEAFVYADILYLFSLYTGPSLSFNVGTFNFDMIENGEVRAITANGPVTLNEQIGTVVMKSENGMHPYYILPKWTVGLEINLWVLKLQVEGAAILTSIADSGMIQAGVRMQF